MKTRINFERINCNE